MALEGFRSNQTDDQLALHALSAVRYFVPLRSGVPSLNSSLRGPPYRRAQGANHFALISLHGAFFTSTPLGTPVFARMTNVRSVVAATLLVGTKKRGVRSPDRPSSQWDTCQGTRNHLD